jgi:hypothetical protein
MAQSDLQIKTSLIDGRYLDGEYEFFRNLYNLFPKRYFTEKSGNLWDPWLRIFTSAAENIKTQLTSWNPTSKKEKEG